MADDIPAEIALAVLRTEQKYGGRSCQRIFAHNNMNFKSNNLSVFLDRRATSMDGGGRRVTSL